MKLINCLPTGLLSNTYIGALIRRENILLWSVTDALLHIMNQVVARINVVMNKHTINTEYIIKS